MFEEKDSFWKKKGFYVSVCTAVICLVAIGTVYYRMNNNVAKEQEKMVAQLAATDAPNQKDSAPVSRSLDKTVEEEKQLNHGDEQDEITQMEEMTGADKASEKLREDEVGKTRDKEQKEKKDTSKLAKTSAKKEQKKRSFDMDAGLSWPIKENILKKFDDKGTTFFETLGVYQCNPALLIGGKAGDKVKASAPGTVLSVKKEEETGVTVTVDIGSKYKVIYGQLKGVKVQEGDSIKTGSVIGALNKPTKYYTEEGTHLYFQVLDRDTPVDPLLLLK